MTLSVNAITDTTEDLFGKTVDELQTNVSVGNTGITGTLKYVDDYTGFSGDPALQEGNYLALHCEVSGVDDATIKVTLTNTATLDEDGDIVLRIADKDSQTVTVVAEVDGEVVATKEYGLSDLVVLNS